MTSFAKPHPILEAPSSDLGEGPVWDEREQRIMWVDIDSGHLHAYCPSSGQQKLWTLGGRCGFASPTSHPDRWIAARESSICALSLTSGNVTELYSLDERPGYRCNDGQSAPDGTLWVGTVPSGEDWGQFNGTLFQYRDADSAPKPQRTATGCSNGLAWSPDGRWMYYIDSMTQRIDRYDWPLTGGDLGPPQTLAKFDQTSQGVPDGMTIDRDGHLWVAFWGGWCVRQIHGQTGDILQQVDLPAAQITSCAFGGPDYRTLFITSAKCGLSSEARAAQPHAGRLFSCVPGSVGLPPNLCSV